MSRWAALLFFLAALAAALWHSPRPAEPAFLAPAAATVSPLPAEFEAGMLPAAAPSAHAATLAQLPDGRIAAAWFAGSKEGAADVAVWFSTREGDGWRPPRPVARRDSTARSTLTHVRKLGNPVLHAEGERLHLWFVSAAVGGWAGSSINHSLSPDGGATWSEPEKLRTSPFFNISTLVRTAAVPLADGGLGLPVYHEFLGKHGEWLRLAADGRILDKVRLPLDRPTLQPAVAALDSQRAVAWLRDAGPGPGRIRAAASGDGGRTWEALSALPLGNPNSSLAALRLPSGRLLLAGNPGEGRHRLVLWLSEDEGHSWRMARIVEADTDEKVEFSYPALLLAQDGRIHLAWTWRRQGIRHAVFTEAWLLEKGK
jgi:predicted neuraminidase